MNVKRLFRNYKHYLLVLVLILMSKPFVYSGVGKVEVSSITLKTNEHLCVIKDPTKAVDIGPGYIYVENSSGFVGINISSPAYKLDVNGSVRSNTGGLVFSDYTVMTTTGTLTANALSDNNSVAFTADSDTNAQGESLFFIGATEAMTILNNQNVGIGEIAPTSKLDVGGDITASTMSLSGTATLLNLDTGNGNVELYASNQDMLTTSTPTFAGLTVTNQATADTLAADTVVIQSGNISLLNSAQANILAVDSVQTSSITATGSAIYFEKKFNVNGNDLTGQRIYVSSVAARTSQGLYLVEDGGNGIFIQDGGNIGIGTNNPLYALDAAGSIRISEGEIVFPDGSKMTTANGLSAFGMSSSTEVVVAADASTGNVGEINFFAGAGEHMTILNNGNVGIGSVDPQYKLDSTDSIRISTGALYFPDATFMTTADVGTASSASNPLDMLLTADTDVDLNGEFHMIVNAVRQMTIVNNGNVGIGSIAPNAKLDVNGTAQATTLTTSAGSTTGTLDTGQGAYELYPMNQNMQTTNNVAFATSTITNTISANTITDSLLSISAGDITSIGNLSGNIGQFNEVTVASITAKNTDVYLVSDMDSSLSVILADVIEVSTVQAKTASGLNLTDDAANSLFVQDGGNVGIGNNSPDYPLDVTGSIRFSQGAIYFADGSSKTTAGFGHIALGENNYDFVVAVDTDTNNTGRILFETSNSTRMVAANSGNIGIGTLSPVSLFQVSANTLGVEHDASVCIGTTTGNSNMNIYGSFTGPVDNLTATHTANETDFTFNFSGVINYTLNLPIAGTCTGRVYLIRVNMASNKKVVIQPYTTENINGAAKISINGGQSIIIACDGSAWFSY
ncbi:beta strand repeat-containing protein [bacterium]